MSIAPEDIAFAICCVAVSPDEQNRAQLYAAVVFGKPAASAAALTKFAALPSRTCTL